MYIFNCRHCKLNMQLCETTNNMNAIKKELRNTWDCEALNSDVYIIVLSTTYFTDNAAIRIVCVAGRIWHFRL